MTLEQYKVAIVISGGGNRNYILSMKDRSKDCRGNRAFTNMYGLRNEKKFNVLTRVMFVTGEKTGLICEVHQNETGMCAYCFTKFMIKKDGTARITSHSECYSDELIKDSIVEMAKKRRILKGGYRSDLIHTVEC